MLQYQTYLECSALHFTFTHYAVTPLLGKIMQIQWPDLLNFISSSPETMHTYFYLQIVV